MRMVLCWKRSVRDTTDRGAGSIPNPCYPVPKRPSALPSLWPSYSWKVRDGQRRALHQRTCYRPSRHSISTLYQIRKYPCIRSTTGLPSRGACEPSLPSGRPPPRPGSQRTPWDGRGYLSWLGSHRTAAIPSSPRWARRRGLPRRASGRDHRAEAFRGATRKAIWVDPHLSASMMPEGRHLTSVGSLTMVMTIVRLTLVIVGSAVYIGLAILGWGVFTAFFSHPALVALAVTLFIMAGASLLAGGNLSPGLREDRGNRWVLVAFALIGLLDGYLPAYTDRKKFWTIDGDIMRWLGVVL